MIRIGVDFGGTKIEGAAIDEAGDFKARVRLPNPGGYALALTAVAEVVEAAEREAGQRVDHVGVGIPGSLSPDTGLVRGANSTWLNGQAFDRDLEARLDRKVTMENDANCFVLSEALPEHADAVVFGAIVGTGCGGGIVHRGEIVSGHNRIAGEWGHSPLPWPTAAENGAHACWCGRRDCLETWISGTAFQADFAEASGRRLKGHEIVAAARQGDVQAAAALDRYIDRLARSLAVVCNLLDPDVIVLGGGMSNVSELYGEALHQRLAELAFTDRFRTRVRPPRHGDSSGVRGAAWLAPL